MENYYYIPVNSLNFTNILSTESISPASNYGKRGFGFRKLERINANPFNNSIIAYSKIPLLEEIKSDREEFPLYLSVPLNYFSKYSKQYFIGDISLIQTDETVYLNVKECFFVVKNAIDKKKLEVAKQRSLEVKFADTYINEIYLFEEFNFKSFNWSEDVLADVTDFKNSNSKGIEKDQNINKIKGFVFGYASGKLREQPQEISQGKQFFKEFVNSYASLMNELSVFSSKSNKYESKFDTSRIFKELEHLKDLKNNISLLFNENEQSEVDNTIKKVFKASDENIELFKALNYNKSKNTVYSIVEEFVKTKNNELYSIDELLEALISRAKSFVNYNSQIIYKNLDADFNSFRILINNKIDSFQKENNTLNSFDKIPFQLSNNLKLDKFSFNELNVNQNTQFSIIVEEFLSRLTMSSSDEIAQQRLDVITHIVKFLKSKTSLVETEIEYLRRLYKSLKTVGVGFKIREVNNEALQSIACFLSRYSELEKLQDFMEKNKYANYGLTYSLWGAAYGYSNMSKIIFESLYTNQSAVNVLDKFTANLMGIESLDVERKSNFLYLLKRKKKVESKSKNSYTKEWSIGNNKVNESDVEVTSNNQLDYVELLQKNKSFVKNDEWLTAIKFCIEKVEQEAKEFGGMYAEIESKLGNLEGLLKEEQKHLNGFGNAKRKEALNIYKNYLLKDE